MMRSRFAGSSPTGRNFRRTFICSLHKTLPFRHCSASVHKNAFQYGMTLLVAAYGVELSFSGSTPTPHYWHSATKVLGH